MDWKLSGLTRYHSHPHRLCPSPPPPPPTPPPPSCSSSPFLLFCDSFLCSKSTTFTLTFARTWACKTIAWHGSEDGWMAVGEKKKSYLFLTGTRREWCLLELMHSQNITKTRDDMTRRQKRNKGQGGTHAKFVLAQTTWFRPIWSRGSPSVLFSSSFPFPVCVWCVHGDEKGYLGNRTS